MSYALITGASSGIGYELAKLFAKEKHNIVLIEPSDNSLSLTFLVVPPHRLGGEFKCLAITIGHGGF